MKKATAKKTPTRKKTTVHASRAAVATKTTKTATTPYVPLGKQPQSKEQASTQAGVFLYTDDAWSMAYFNPSDLHCAERELFG
jgi:hypothetical protein